MELNTSYYLEINGEAQQISVASLDINGRAYFLGSVYVIKEVIKPGTSFTIFRKKDNDDNEIIVTARIVEIVDQTIFDLVARTSDEATEITTEVEATCIVKYCKWFI